MKNYITLLLLTMSMFVSAQNSRLIVTTDIGGTDPDDQQSMVHLLLMSNDVDIEGLICQMAFVKSPIGTDTLLSIINAYSKVESNLRVHDKRYPSADYLRSIAVSGQTDVGMAGVGEGKDTPGSEQIIAAVDRKDSRPIWLTAWGGMNTIAQALWKVKNTRSKKNLDKFISRIRIYDILGQCDAGAWIAKTFPDILYLRARDVYSWQPDDEWTKKNIQAFAAMGKVYPNRVWATEGDTPAFLYTINNGLNMPEIPSAGGWGGLFSKEPTANVRGMSWVEKNNLNESQYDDYLMYTNPQGKSSISRWSDAIRNDFAARIQWSVNNDYKTTNHHPVILLNKEKVDTRKPLYIKAKDGREIKIKTGSSYDPDGNKFTLNAYILKEASEYDGNLMINSDNCEVSFVVPTDAAGKTIHIVIEATDDGQPALTSYRRLIIN